MYAVIEVAAWRSYCILYFGEELLVHKICSIPGMYQYYKAFVTLVNTRHLKELLSVARYRPCAQPNTIWKLLYRDSAHAVTL